MRMKNTKKLSTDHWCLYLIAALMVSPAFMLFRSYFRHTSSHFLTNGVMSKDWSDLANGDSESLDSQKIFELVRLK